MSTFHEILFPPAISYGSSGGPRFKTTVFTSDAGYEQRNIDWSQPRSEWDVAHSMRDLVGTAQLVSIETLAAFFMARNGRKHGFRFRDPADCEIINQVIAVGDGVRTDFPIIKTYRSAQAESGADFSFTRKIRKIEWDTVEDVEVNGSILPPFEWSVDPDTAILSFVTPPALDAEIKIGRAVFHIPARFDTDHCDVTAEFWNAASWPSIPIVEIRD